MTLLERLLVCIALFELICTFHDKPSFGVNGFLQRKPLSSHPCNKKIVSSSLLIVFDSTNNPKETMALLDDLEPPPINLRRGSILFDENPQTKRNNDVLTLWKMTRTNLPKFVTGAWRNDTGDDNPLGALYNMAFVRLPIILAFAGYVKNNIDGHPLFVDFGSGPLEFAPIAATALLILMLGPSFFIIEKQNIET